MSTIPKILSVLYLCLFNGLAANALESVEEVLVDGADTVIFAAQIPDGYSPDSPPAIVVAWHGWGSSQYEIFSSTEFDTEANRRGWILTSHIGQTYTHWNNYQAQRHCRIMLDWLTEHYPFDRDSIYMIGGSMGGAAGQVWHVNNCGSDDYLVAATAGGSQILDLEYRALQYLADGDTNTTMRDLFGGLPGVSDSTDYEYHRASAVYLADTTESMHFNALTLPVWCSWGSSQLELIAYALPALDYQLYYRAGIPELNEFFPSEINQHGYRIMWAEGVCNWLSRFSVNRYPDHLSIAADENDDYYYTTAELGQTAYTFGRYAVLKNPQERRIDITLIRNIQALAVNFDFPWANYDTLRGFWSSLDESVENPVIRLHHTPQIDTIYREDGIGIEYSLEQEQAEIPLAEDGEYTVVFEPQEVESPNQIVVQDYAILAAYPNPFNAEVSLRISSPRASVRQLQLFNVQGQIVYSAPVLLQPGENQVSLNASSFGSGIYFVTIQIESIRPLKLIHLK
jgi:hypothetical protein